MGESTQKKRFQAWYIVYYVNYVKMIVYYHTSGQGGIPYRR